MALPAIKAHPLKAEIEKLHLQLWKIRHALGGSPSETTISRALNGIDPMSQELENKIRGVIEEYKRPLVQVK